VKSERVNSATLWAGLVSIAIYLRKSAFICGKTPLTFVVFASLREIFLHFFCAFCAFLRLFQVPSFSLRSLRSFAAIQTNLRSSAVVLPS
jgi:hypothetical protein